MDGVDEAEVDDVAGEFGVVAVAEGFADGGFGEHGRCFDDSGTPWRPGAAGQPVVCEAGDVGEVKGCGCAHGRAGGC